MSEGSGQIRDKPEYPVRLLALDVDGTILDPQSCLNADVKKALLQALEQGIKIVLCTGRRFRRALSVAEEIGLKTPLVCNSGALVKCPESSQTLWKAEHSPNEASYLIRVFQQFDVPILSFLDSPPENPDLITAQFPSGCELFDDYLEKNRDFMELNPNWLEDADFHQGHFHLCAAGTIEKMNKISEHLESERPGFYQIFVQKSPAYRVWMCEVLRRDANKWTALNAVAEQWGIRPSEICAVGDDANDVPMIRNAGWGVAMDHSPEFVKKHAQWIAPSNVDDGVIAVVEKLIKA
ncbi:MAG: hypothetical protein RJA81_1247 [Planctomycetota bacterium]